MEHMISLNEEKLSERSFNRKEFDWITRRFVSIGYYALLASNQVIPKKNDIDESIDWYPIKNLPPMIMDHHEIVERAGNATPESRPEIDCL